MKYPDDFINKIICGDCLDVMKDMPSNCIDLIFTDPPYDEDSISLYERLAIGAGRVLKNGGNLLVYCGHYAIPKILNLMTPHLRYWWMIAIKHGGHSARLLGKRLFVEWKPILWFIKGTRGYEKFIADYVQSFLPDKKYHKWQQGYTEAFYYMSRLTKNGDTILDPFLGGGTTARVAKDSYRNFIGIEINPDYCKIAEERLAQGVL